MNIIIRFSILGILFLGFSMGCTKDSTPYGGATFPEGGVVKTIYSVVTQSSELKIWLKVRGYSGYVSF